MAFSRLGQLALSYAERGWRVFPVFPPTKDGNCPCSNPSCTKAGKHPAIESWTTEATTDSRQIIDWWTLNPSYNIGITTGVESNLFVLDADGATGLLAIEERGLKETPPSVRTGRIDGGTHFYFRYPKDISVRNFVGKVPGLDVRGNGGYVIGAGSKHKTGSTYEWINSPNDYDLPEAPKWLIDLLTEPKATNGYQSTVQGERNSTLFMLATSLRRKGMSIERVLEESRIVNQSYRPPLDDFEVRTIVESACRAEYASAPDYEIHLRDPDLVETITVTAPYLRSLPLTELGTAEAFANMVGTQFRYVYEWGKWLRWNGSIWTPDATNAALRTMALVIRTRYMAATYEEDKDTRAFIEKWARGLESNGHITSTLAKAAFLTELIEKPSNFDTHRMLLGMNKWTYDLQQGFARVPNSLDKLTLAVSPNYDPEATCPLWEKTLLEVFEGNNDMVSFFQRAIGYSITGSNIEQCLFICHGFGANGKSTILSVIREVVGDYAATARFETFDAGKTSSRGEDLAMLRGKRFVLVVEPDADMKFAEGKIKQITGGEDLITCRHLYEKDFSYRPEFTLWMALNHKPKITGTDAGIWRRIRLIPFRADFSDDTKRNRYLAEELKLEASGILNWILDGVKQWLQQGLNPPKEVIDATNIYRSESDIFGLWLEECVKIDVNDEKCYDNHNALYSAYTTWCRMNNYRPVTGNMFGRQLTERGFAKSLDKHRKTIYRGIQAVDFGDYGG
jgi:putative DNA primase/helicase